MASLPDRVAQTIASDVQKHYDQCKNNSKTQQQVFSYIIFQPLPVGESPLRSISVSRHFWAIDEALMPFISEESNIERGFNNSTMTFKLYLRCKVNVVVCYTKDDVLEMLNPSHRLLFSEEVLF